MSADYYSTFTAETRSAMARFEERYGTLPDKGIIEGVWSFGICEYAQQDRFLPGAYEEVLRVLAEKTFTSVPKASSDLGPYAEHQFLGHRGAEDEHKSGERRGFVIIDAAWDKFPPAEQQQRIMTAAIQAQLSVTDSSYVSPAAHREQIEMTATILQNVKNDSELRWALHVTQEFVEACAHFKYVIDQMYWDYEEHMRKECGWPEAEEEIGR